MRKRISVLGCGPWATVMARLMAENVQCSKQFDENIRLFVYNERYQGQSLATTINEQHVNPVYFPGFRIPQNVTASCNIKEVVSGAHILAIAYPSRHVPWLLEQAWKYVGEDAYFITFSKGLIVDPVKNELTLVSDLVRQKTERPCIPVIGATTALEVAWKHFTEATIGSDNLELGREVKSLLQTSYFRLVISDDPVGVELCGALKNVVSIAAGIVDGLEQGDNTKSAILRIGFWEMIELMKELFPNRGVKDVTLEQSCGIAELFVCMSHRSDVLPAVGTDVDVMNIVLGKALAQERRASVNGTPELNEIRSQHVDGAEYAQVINAILTKRNIAQRFPLFTAVNDICQQKMSPRNFIDCLRRHPIHQ